MGYPSFTTAASIQFGVPALTQTNFLIERALQPGALLSEAVDQVRSIVKTMDDIEFKLIDAQDRLAATQLEELHLNNSEPDMLEKEYRRWGYRLADIVGAPIYPYARRYMVAAEGVTNIAVRG